jgi:tryptophan halogenase
MNSNGVKKVVIAGGGTAGWMAAAAISKLIGKNLDIKLVESDDIPTVGVGEATIPPLLTFHRLLGINEQEFVTAVNATFKLGIDFRNWREPDHRYFHSFGTTGKDCWAATFHHFWLKGLKDGYDADFGEYCLELKAAEANKFAHLPKNGLNYAYHLDAGLYARFLRKIAEKNGVHRVEGKIATVKQNVETGFIQALELESGTTVEGDLFVDCTGFRGLLIEGALHTGYEDWSHWLPCDSAVAVQTKAVGELTPYTRVTAHELGWQWRIPLQNRMGNGLVYCGRYLSDDKAKMTLLNNVEGEAITEPRVIKFQAGQRRKHWNKNCVALGLASGFIEPLESTSIHAIQRGVIRLMQLFPANGISQPDIDEFNAQTKFEADYIRDFIILHYKVTNRSDSPFWRYCKNMEVPGTLQHRIDLFRESGRIFQFSGELFAENSWVQVMLGQGIMPKDYHPIADMMSKDEQREFLDGIRTSVRKTVEQLPSHQDYLKQYCPR